MLARWNPWQEMLDLERAMSDLTRRLFGGALQGGPARQGNRSAWIPPVDVFSREGDLVVRVEVPGVDPAKEIDISFQDGLLTIRGERRHEEKSEQENYYRFESSSGTFQRSVPVPRDVKPEDITASYDQGVLEVVVAKAASLPAPRKIAVSVGEGKKALTTKGEKK